jgi:Fe-S cluster assembly iron-binding protein IscA
MALDEPKDDDSVFDVNGFQFIMEKEFYEKAQPVKVDFLTTRKSRLFRIRV